MLPQNIKLRCSFVCFWTGIFRKEILISIVLLAVDDVSILLLNYSTSMLWRA